jgi:CubicO group peptidase (beta-lactamase class C family)
MNYPKLIVITTLFATNSLFGEEFHPNEVDIKQILENRVDKRKSSPGIVVGIIDKDGPKIYSYGKFDADSTNLVTGDTVFEIGSISKAFTGMLLAQAIHRGDVDLDDRAAKYLPASVKLPSRDGKEITLRHLTTHTSGLPRLPGNLTPQDSENPYADYTVEQLYAYLGKCKLNSIPGEEYAYSNLGAGLLGHILALRAGTNYEALVRRDICEPLGMTDTRITLTKEMNARLAPGHNAKGKRVKNWDIPTLAGAGALRSTANDVLELLAANIGLSNTNLLPAFEKSHVSRHDAGAPGMEIGFGWHISLEWGARCIWHNGGTGGYHSFAGFDKKQQRGVVVIANSENDIDDIGFNVLHLRRVAKIDYKIYEEYVGRYDFPISGQFVITREGDRLFAKLDKQSALEVFPESATQFTCALVDARLTFVRDKDGAMSHLVLHQNGIDQKAKRAK